MRVAASCHVAGQRRVATANDEHRGVSGRDASGRSHHALQVRPLAVPLKGAPAAVLAVREEAVPVRPRTEVVVRPRQQLLDLRTVRGKCSQGVGSQQGIRGCQTIVGSTHALPPGW